jgi:hypothetical protein
VTQEERDVLYVERCEEPGCYWPGPGMCYRCRSLMSYAYLLCSVGDIPIAWGATKYALDVTQTNDVFIGGRDWNTKWERFSIPTLYRRYKAVATARRRRVADKTPEGREKRLAARRELRRKQRQDPEFRAAEKAKKKARYDAMSPEEKEALLQKARERCKKRNYKAERGKRKLKKKEQEERTHVENTDVVPVVQVAAGDVTKRPRSGWSGLVGGPPPTEPKKEVDPLLLDMQQYLSERLSSRRGKRFASGSRK